MEKSKLTESEVVAITNIPPQFHASDLRSHFSSLVESRSFPCFHFRHRPEKVGDIAKNNISLPDLEEQKSSTRNNHSRDHHEEPSRELKFVKRCCVVRVLKTKWPHLLKYNNQNWTDVNGDFLTDKCHISHLKIKRDDNKNKPRSKTSGEKNNDEREAVDEETLLKMPEFNPPELMANGNVGTPTLVFLDLIQRCLLPRTLINKLQLKFSKTSARRLYGGVNFEYEEADSSDEVKDCTVELQKLSHRGHNRVSGLSGLVTKIESYKTHCPSFPESEDSLRLHTDESVDTEISLRLFKVSSNTDADARSVDLERGMESSKSGSFSLSRDVSSNVDVSLFNTFRVPNVKVVSVNSRKNLSSTGVSESVLLNKERKRIKREERQRIKKLKAENIEEKLIAAEKSYYDEHDAEEWDRHEASEDDPSNQERNKERLYEEEIEQPWEKGGPGVVFYTDAMYWQEQEGDFDEQTTDDLDVDFSAYEEEGGGDKDIKDFLRIRQEKRFHSGYDNTDRFSIGIGKRIVAPNFRNDKCSKPDMDSQEYDYKTFGSKIMERHGWKRGQGLGKSSKGLVTALKGEGQGPHMKQGLGYKEMKLPQYGISFPKRSRTQPHLITTVYDDPAVEDPKEPLLLRSDPSTLTHRQSHLDKFS